MIHMSSISHASRKRKKKKRVESLSAQRVDHDRTSSALSSAHTEHYSCFLFHKLMSIMAHQSLVVE